MEVILCEVAEEVQVNEELAEMECKLLEMYQNIQLSQVDASIPFKSLPVNLDSQGGGNFLTNIFSTQLTI